MSRTLVLLELALIAGLPLPRLKAQGDVAPTVGSRVRFYAPPHVADTTVGVVLAYASETLTVRRLEGGDTLALPYSAIACMDVRRTHRYPIRGLITGAFVGGAVGAAIAGTGPGCAAQPCSNEGDRVVRGTVRLSIAGGVLGLVVGTLTATERWEAVPLSCLRPAAADLTP